jgi:hypothetical protein
LTFKLTGNERFSARAVLRPVVIKRGAKPLATTTLRLTRAKTGTLVLRFKAPRAWRSLPLKLVLTVTDVAGNKRTITKTVTLKRTPRLRVAIR